MNKEFLKMQKIAGLIKENQNQVNENLIINEEFDNRMNGFSNIFLKTYYDMSDHTITFDEAVDKLFTWIKANFK